MGEEEQTGTTDVLSTLLGASLVIVTGKGGVGKTTVTAALAKLGARSGRRVLACEVGQEPGVPSRLGEALTGKKVLAPPEPVEVAPGVDLVLLTPEAGHRAFLREVLPFGFLADRALKAEPVKRFLSAAPALLELGVLYRGLALMKTGRWPLLVLDAPATGHAVAFASLPEVALKIFPVGPIARALREGVEVLTDPKRTVTLVTTLPETLPVSEALELVKGLEKQRMKVGGVVANLVPTDPFEPGEHDAVEGWLTGHHEAGGVAPRDVLGHRSMGRLRRAKGALDRLKGEAGQALLTVRERVNEGGSLVDWVASELGGA